METLATIDSHELGKATSHFLDKTSKACDYPEPPPTQCITNKQRQKTSPCQDSQEQALQRTPKFHPTQPPHIPPPPTFTAPKPMSDREPAP